MLKALSKPVRVVVGWQVIATATLAFFAGALAGVHGAASAALGGFVSILACVAAGLLVTRRQAESAAGMLYEALKAEGAKLGLSAFLVWLVFVRYEEVVPIAFLGSFVITVLVFSMAFFIPAK